MTPFWIETGTAMRLAIVPRPRGNDWLEDEVTQMKRAGVDVLVSMLQPDEATELGLSTEAKLCAAGGIQFRSFPIPDRETPPSTAAFAKFVEELSLPLAALLTAEGYTADDAFRRLTTARGLQVPDTPDQIRWVERFAERHVP